LFGGLKAQEAQSLIEFFFSCFPVDQPAKFKDKMHLWNNYDHNLL